MSLENVHFSRGLKWLRDKEGWTQKELVTRSGSSQQVISRVETGAAAAGAATQWRLAKAFGLTPEGVIAKGKALGGKIIKQDFVGDRVRQIIEKSGWNQTEFAKQIGVSPKTINLWLNWQSRPSAKNARAIESKTGHYHRWLLEDEFGGPSSVNAQWYYENKGVRLTHQEAAGLYERLYEIIDQLGIDKAKLVDMASIQKTVLDDWYFLGSVPTTSDIKKIADATGYSPDWVLKGAFPKKQDAPCPTVNLVHTSIRPKHLEHKEYFEWLKEILESDDEETKHSIISNLKTFVRTIRMNQRLLRIESPEEEDNSGLKKFTK